MKEKIRLGAVIFGVMVLAITLFGLSAIKAQAQLLDVTFKIDESGSMGDDQADVQARVNDIFQSLSDAGLDFTVGLVGFGAGGAPHPHGSAPFIHTAQTADQTTFQNAVNELVITGSVEPGYDAVVLAETSSEMGLREGAAVCNILISDEPSNGDTNTQQQAIDALNANNAVFFGIVLPGTPTTSYQPLADATGGQIFDLLAFRADPDAVLQAVLTACKVVATGGLDHYLGYTTRSPRGEPNPTAVATLTDQFGEGKYKILGKSITHLNPTEKTKGDEFTPITQPDVHLDAYPLMQLEGSHTPQTVEVTNQFGTITVTTKSPSKLLVPSTKAIEGAPPRTLPDSEDLPEDRVDHFLCYTLDSFSGFTSLTVGVNDQFDQFREIEEEETSPFSVVRPIYLCNPVAKLLEGKDPEDTEVIKNEAGHLVCYGGGIKVRRSLEVTIGVNNQIVEANELESQTLEITREAGVLCVPSTKNFPGGFCGDGVVDEGEECDLGAQNGVPDSGCSSQCTIEIGDEK